MMATATQFTIEDFERLSDDEARNKELVNGELVDVSGNTSEHLDLQTQLLALLWAFAREHKLGKVLHEQEYRFGKDAHGPDVSFFGPAKLPFLERKRRVQPFVPDLAIEIASYNEKFGQLEEKIAKYLDHGVGEVWVFSLVRQVAFVYSRDRAAVLGKGDLFAPAALPGFSISIGELFERD